MGRLSRIKLSYIPAQFRIRCNLTRQQCRRGALPPDDLLDRARSKLDSEVQSGRLESFRIFEDRLLKIWNLLREGDFESGTEVNVTIASGIPPLPGLAVLPSKTAGVIAWAKFGGEPKAKDWTFPVVELAVHDKLSELGIDTPIDPAHLHASWIRSYTEGVKDAIPLTAMPIVPLDKMGDSGFVIRRNRDAGEISVIVQDLERVLEEAILRRVVGLTRKAAKEEQNASGRHFLTMEEHLVRTLRSAGRGPQLLGLDMPLVILSAHVLKVDGEEMPAEAQEDTEGVPTLAEKHPFADVDPIIEGGTVAKLPDFPKIEDEVNPDLLKSWLHSKGVVFGIDEAALAQACNTIKGGQSAKDTMIAKAEPPKAGEEPYVHAVYKDASQQSDGKSADSQGLRDAQQVQLVTKGDRIAEVRFAVAAIPGTNVLGKPIAPPRGDPPEIECGEGATTEDGWVFVATREGAPEVSDTKVEVREEMHIEGNVDLASGNIRASGNVRIDGHIDEGAVVDVAGCLSVGGSILGGFVRVGDNLHVEDGIVGGANCAVKVKGDAKAKYLQNAHMRVHGELVVDRAILGGHIEVGKKLIMTEDEAVLAGGFVQCTEGLETFNLGRGGGTGTVIEAGSNLRWGMAVNIRTERLEKLKKEAEAAAGGAKSLDGPAGNKRTKSIRAKAKDRQKRLEALVDKASKSLEKAKAKVKFNADAKIAVKGELDTNVKIRIAGQKVGVPEPFAGVLITSKRVKGSFLQSLEEKKEAS